MRPINYDGRGNVMAYHTMRNLDGSTVEHATMVALSNIQNAVKDDGTSDPDTLLLVCPTCGAQAWVPILGGREAQNFHVQVQVARGQTLAAATLTVINTINSLGGTPVISANAVGSGVS